MEVKDLRSGSLVYDENDVICVVASIIEAESFNCEIHTKYLGGIDTKNTLVKPIPIGSGILRMLGFEHEIHDNTLTVFKKGVDGLPVNPWRICLYTKAGSSIWLRHVYKGKELPKAHTEHHIAHIKYAHQLQNIWKALTGEELTVTVLV